jgi:hypothetical protein
MALPRPRSKLSPATQISIATCATHKLGQLDQFSVSEVVGFHEPEIHADR